jgi:hypothetical protein
MFIKENHVRLIESVPTELFNSTKNEIDNINWDSTTVISDFRKRDPVFATSITTHLRTHKLEQNTPRTREAVSDIIECKDSSVRYMYPQINSMIEWCYSVVNGKELGRIMVVKLLPGGRVIPHIDTGLYFQRYHRFHVPITTNSQVLFIGPADNKPIHMPKGILCQLMNRQLHGVENNSNDDRIHIIVDIDTNKFD